ncbi:MINOS1 [Mytilus edulis]|uniref:MICOS complex subunit MIC10 n=1 Tax=Mytilus edulis TaxID=6550 RepID=A0A8S3S0T5_MYTED|nr:MINOS1 [Mytilus edulis]
MGPGNTNLYKTKLKELLAQQISIHNNQTTTDIVAIIIDCLKKAEKQSIPSRIIKLNGPKIKVSPEAKRLLNLSKQKHRIWVVKGHPTGTDKSYIEREAKYNARKILRKERAIEKENFYHQLEQQPSNKTFFKLINRNMGRENLNTQIEEENLVHFITRCPVLEGIRRKHYGTIKQEIVNKIGSIQWNNKFRDRDIICQLITDCRKLTGEYLPCDAELMNNIESTSPSGLGVGIVLSFILFKRKTWPVALGTGFGLGMGYSNCQNDFQQPYLLHGKRVKAPLNGSQS